jgi:hypothetical protein
MLLRRGPVESRIVRSLNIRFDKGGLITKPFLKKKTKKLIFRYLLKTEVRLRIKTDKTVI